MCLPFPEATVRPSAPISPALPEWSLPRGWKRGVEGTPHPLLGAGTPAELKSQGPSQDSWSLRTQDAG